MGLHAVKSHVYRVLVTLYLSFEAHCLSRLHEDYRRAISRALLGVKRRLFPGQGKGMLLAGLTRSGANASHLASPQGQPQPERSFRVETLAAPDRTFVMLHAQASESVRHEPWLWLEQENLVPVLRHLQFGALDWCSLPVVQGAGSIAATPNLDAIIELLPDSGLSHVLLLPWLNPGGADKAALCYLQVLAARYPGRVMAITTEACDSSWRSRVPRGVVVVDWACIEPWADTEAALQGLLRLLKRADVAVLHVMNSFLGWELLKRHGLRVRALTRVFGSLFWYGPSEPRALRGYAPEYLPSVSDYLDGVLTDNHTFAQRLCCDYGFAPELFHCVYHPTEQVVDLSDEERLPEQPFPILWASRFAPEKRLDVLAEIAERRPQLEFHVFGGGFDLPDTVLSAVERLNSLPNVHMRGAFHGFESLPLREYGLFLYTSSSDGMPNVVIEALAGGLPVVAPDVGGISELIDEETGWLVCDSNSIDAYLAALDAALADRASSETRRRAGVARVRERHNVDVFEKTLLSVPRYMTEVH